MPAKVADLSPLENIAAMNQITAANSQEQREKVENEL
jgi:hypothetical protein